MSYEDERVLEFVAYGFVGGPMTKTTRTPGFGAWERRNTEWPRMRWRYRAPYDRISPEHHAAMQACFVACDGPRVSFRFKDFSDFRLTDAAIGTADGSTDQELQIIKPYTFGTLTRNRVITKPVDSTRFTKAGGYVADAAPLVVKAAGTPISFAVDYLTGIVTFTATTGQAITVDGEFDVPVYFDQEELEFDMVNWEAHSTEITLLEDFNA